MNVVNFTDEMESLLQNIFGEIGFAQLKAQSGAMGLSYSGCLEYGKTLLDLGVLFFNGNGDVEIVANDNGKNYKR